jgi:hypothetical protein
VRLPPIPICMIRRRRPQHCVAFPDGSGAAYNRRMAARRINEPIEPMTLGNMRANGVRSLDEFVKAQPREHGAGTDARGAVFQRGVPPSQRVSLSCIRVARIALIV